MHFAYPLLALLALCSCSSGKALPLTTEAFARAKRDCGVPDAKLSPSEPRAIVLPGAAPQAERAKQVACLRERLKGTDVRFIGFIGSGDDW